MEPSPKKILIADDEPDILEIVGYNLTKEGYQVTTAKDGDEAIAKAKMVKPELIILDIMMPKKNGVEVCEILRAKPAFKDTLIIFLTALSDESSTGKGTRNRRRRLHQQTHQPKSSVKQSECSFQKG